MIDQALVFQVAAAYQLPVDLLTAQVQVESGGDPFAFRCEECHHCVMSRYSLIILPMV